jgi:integrase
MAARDPVLTEYAGLLRDLGRSRSSLDNFDHAARRFQRWLDAEKLTAAEVGPRDIMRYFNGGGRWDKYAAATKRLDYTMVKAAYRYAEDPDDGPPLVERTPFRRRVEPPKVELPKPKSPDVEALRKMKREASRLSWRHQLLFMLFVFTGMRSDEVARLTWEDIDLDEGIMEFKGAKTGKYRRVPLHPELRDLLSRCPTRDTKLRRRSVDMLSDKPAKVVMAEIGKRTGPVLWTSRGGHAYTAHSLRCVLVPAFAVDGWTSRMLGRRAVETTLARNGVDSTVRDELLGHAHRTMGAKHYQTVSDDDLKDAVSRMYQVETGGEGL